MRALITGVGGFVGRHLVNHLLDEGDEVCGLGRAADVGGISSVRVFRADLADRAAVERVLREAQPEAVYHLAAQSSPAQSLGDPWRTIGNNLLAQINLFEALLSTGLRPRVLVVGSSDEYGSVRPEHVPTNEDVPLRPTTPYAVSKVGQDMMGFQYFAQHHLPIVRVRPFNHTGPGHDARFVIPSIARQLAHIEAGERGAPPLLRPVAPPRQQADISKFIHLCGWQPRIAWQTTLQDTLQYWRQRVGSSNEEKVCVS